MEPEVVLSIDEVHKAFGATKALAGVSLELHRGRVHCLLGGNGSGKSTLIKVLAGVHRADSGYMTFGTDGVEAKELTPLIARKHGLHFVHQQQSTFPDLTVAENLKIGEGFGVASLGRIKWRELRRSAAMTLERFGIDADPADRLGRLRPATQAMVAIARALQDQEAESFGVLVLDEPTASLPIQEVELLLDAVKRYADSGQSILFVTHRLGEVMRVADDVTVFRDGNVVASLSGSEITHDALVRHIVGRELEAVAERTPAAPPAGANLLDVSQVTVGRLVDVGFSIRPGEIVGLAGLLGSGRSTLLQTLFGLTTPASGQFTIDGKLLSLRSPREAMRNGVALVPEDRLTEAAFTGLDVRENLSLAVASEFMRAGRIDRKREREEARRLIADLDVKVEDIDSPFLSMSGGNQQKVIIGRWIRRKPRLLLLDEPTQGVDVGARAEIWRLARDVTATGAAVLAVSSDLEELALVSDRVLVIREGRITHEVTGSDLTEEHLNTILLDQEATYDSVS